MYLIFSAVNLTPERELVALEERPRLHHGAEVDADRDALHVGPGAQLAVRHPRDEREAVAPRGERVEVRL